MSLFETIPLSTLFICLGGVGFASLIHGAIGIGFPLVATPLLSLVTDVRTAILFLVFPTIVNNLANIMAAGRWHSGVLKYWPLAVYGVIGSYLGTKLLVFVPPDFFRPVLVGVILLYLNAERIGLPLSWVHRQNQLALLIFGISAGILGGTVNVMLPALIIYALEVRMSKNTMIQVFNLCFFAGKLTQGIVFYKAGLLAGEMFFLSFPLAFVGLAIMFAGMRIRNRIDTQMYRRWLRRLLVCMVGVLLFQSIQ